MNAYASGIQPSWWQKLWRSLAAGLIYELGFELALALRWLTVREVYSFLLAGLIGIVIAVLLRAKNPLRLLPATLLGLAAAVVWHELAVWLDIPLKIIFLCDPFMREIGYFTANEGITMTFILAGYLIISLLTFLLFIGVKALIQAKKEDLP